MGLVYGLDKARASRIGVTRVYTGDHLRSAGCASGTKAGSSNPTRGFSRGGSGRDLGGENSPGNGSKRKPAPAKTEKSTFISVEPRRLGSTLLDCGHKPSYKPAAETNTWVLRRGLAEEYRSETDRTQPRCLRSTLSTQEPLVPPSTVSDGPSSRSTSVKNEAVTDGETLFVTPVQSVSNIIETHILDEY
ncbi:hypothetical protein Bbelb_157150 [Branchiostoma belcheri]|nr:hypothetical protein Bbelb_157150 [Branchiostoma belcheri]